MPKRKDPSTNAESVTNYYTEPKSCEATGPGEDLQHEMKWLGDLWRVAAEFTPDSEPNIQYVEQ